MSDRGAGETGETGETGEAIGTAAEEAAKLFGALSDWAKDHGSDLSSGLSGVAGHAAEAARGVNEHVSTGAAECAFCPICRTVHAVRQTSPEVRTHLAVAAANLMQAAAGLLATVVPDEARAGGVRGAGVEHIDLDDENATDTEWPEGPEEDQ